MGKAGQTIAVKAMGVIRRPRDGAVLVCEYDGPESAPFHRLLGGHVEFGEHAEDALRREFLEEIGQEVDRLEFLGVVENLFRWRGADGHEVVFVYAAEFVDPLAYGIEEHDVLDDPDEESRVIWRDPAADGPPLYPDGVVSRGWLSRQ